MSRFKASKFKNAKEKIPHIEGWITGLNLGSIQSSYGNHIKASAALMAFNIPSGNGGSLAVLPIAAKGRKDASLPSLQAHSGLVTDFDFNPFDDFQLATCSQDGLIRIWDIPEEGLSETLSTASLTLPQQDSQVEVVSFNPCAGNVLAATTQKLLKIFDIQEGVEKIAMNGHNDTIQSISWKQDGSLLATSAKDKTIRIVDPRQQCISNETAGHENPKDSRICWFGNQDYILSTGASKSRTREAFYFDVRNLKQKVTSFNFDSSSGVMIPLFDPDTNMLFLAGKGDTSIRFYDVCETSPHVREASTYLSKFQSKGAALVRKRAMDVMSCEVNRVLQLTQEGVLPITYEIPRRSHRDFQPELFPDTLGDEPGVSSEEWFDGQNGEVPKVSLNPASSRPVVKKQKSSSTASTLKEADSKPKTGEKASTQAEKPAKPSQPQKLTSSSSGGSNHAAAANSQSREAESVPKEEQKVKKPAFISKRFTSKFRHINIVPMHRSLHFTSVKRVSISTLSESDGFHINKKWAAVPMSGAGGNVAIIDLDNPCKLPEVVPFVEHGSDMTDFTWDPFDDSRLAVTSMNCKITIWKIHGKTADDFSAEVETELAGHNDKIYSIKFHPLAKDVIMSASQDMTVKIWNISTGQEVISLDGHTDQIFSIAWSPDGNQIATLCKDGKIRLYEPRSSTSPVQEHNFVSGSKGARIVFVLGGSHVVVSGQSPVRCLTLFKVSNLASPIHKEELDTSPSFLIPHYDEDTSVLVCTGKGDTSAFLYEVLPESPYLASLAGFSSKAPHQAFSFFPKTSCVVKDVEVMRAMRLTMTTIEPITFTVPRVKKEYFQDDIFPDTRAAWEPALDSGRWFSGEEAKAQRRINLNTDGLKLLSEAPKMNAPPKKYTSQEILEMKTDQEKKEELLSAMTNKLALNEEPLPQDEMEGVEDDEWDD